MQATQKSSETINIPREKLFALVSQMFGGTGDNPNPDEPHKPGPWDPVIRQVASQFFGPRPEPWRLAFGPGVPWRSEFNLHRGILGFLAASHPAIFDAIGDPLSLVALSPQPLPPRAAFLAVFTQVVIDRVLLTQEIADAMNQTGEQQGIIIVGGRLSMLVDELCGNNFKVKIPIPRPKHDTDKMLSALDLLTVAAVFGQNAATVADASLRQELSKAGAKLAEAGIARM